MAELTGDALRPDTPGGPILQGPAEPELASPGKACDQCFTGAVLPGEPRGEMRRLAGLDCYYTPGNRSEGTGSSSSTAIVIAADAFGLGIPNPRLIADRIAAATGHDVWVPDLLEGDYPPMHKLHLIEKPMADKSVLVKLGTWAKVIWSQVVFVGPTFFLRHRRSVLMPLARRFCLALRKEEAVQRIGVVGYCLGGEVSTLLAGTQPLTDAESLPNVNLVDVVVTAHPSFLNASDFQSIRVPFALICAQEDFAFDGIRKEALAVLDKLPASVPTAVLNDHPGTVHGFAARSDLSDPQAKEQYAKALQETIDWFRAHL